MYNLNANFNLHHGIKEKFGRCTDIPQICVFCLMGTWDFLNIYLCISNKQSQLFQLKTEQHLLKATSTQNGKPFDFVTHVNTPESHVAVLIYVNFC